jgi:hypothetical protein
MDMEFYNFRSFVGYTKKAIIAANQKLSKDKLALGNSNNTH